MKDGLESLSERFISFAFFLIEYPLLSSHFQNGLAVRTLWRLCWGEAHTCMRTHTHTHTRSHTLSDQSNKRNAASCATSQLDWQWALAVSSFAPRRMKGHQLVWDVEGTPGIKKRGSSPAGACLRDDLGSLLKQRGEKEKEENFKKHSLRHTCDQLWSAKLES